LLRSWLIVNATTGSFTTTVRTAGGAGVVVTAAAWADFNWVAPIPENRKIFC
jgi:hypothetical protein